VGGGRPVAAAAALSHRASVSVCPCSRAKCCPLGASVNRVIDFAAILLLLVFTAID